MAICEADRVRVVQHSTPPAPLRGQESWSRELGWTWWPLTVVAATGVGGVSDWLLSMLDGQRAPSKGQGLGWPLVSVAAILVSAALAFLPWRKAIGHGVRPKRALRVWALSIIVATTAGVSLGAVNALVSAARTSALTKRHVLAALSALVVSYLLTNVWRRYGGPRPVTLRRRLVKRRDRRRTRALIVFLSAETPAQIAQLQRREEWLLWSSPTTDDDPTSTLDRTLLWMFAASRRLPLDTDPLESVVSAYERHASLPPAVGTSVFDRLDTCLGHAGVARVAKSPMRLAEVLLEKCVALGGRDGDTSRGPTLQFKWEMPLRAVRFHATEGVLQHLIVVASPESLQQVPAFAAIVRGHFPSDQLSIWLNTLYPADCDLALLSGADATVDLADHQVRTTLITVESFNESLQQGTAVSLFAGFDFESFRELTDGLNALYDDLVRKPLCLPESQITVDITGGQKVVSIVGAITSIDRPIQAQYVQTGGAKDVIAYDLISFPSALVDR